MNNMLYMCMSIVVQSYWTLCKQQYCIISTFIKQEMTDILIPLHLNIASQHLHE